MKRWTPERIAALRSMYAEWWDRVQNGGPDDFEAQAAHMILTGALVGFVPDLCDELERLQAERQDGGRPRVVKFDGRPGGWA